MHIYFAVLAALKNELNMDKGSRISALKFLENTSQKQL